MTSSLPRADTNPVNPHMTLLQERLAALKAIDAEVRAIVADAAEFARISPEPDPSELFTDIYVGAER